MKIFNFRSDFSFGPIVLFFLLSFSLIQCSDESDNTTGDYSIADEKISISSTYVSIKLSWSSIGLWQELYRSENDGEFEYLEIVWSASEYEDFEVYPNTRYRYKIIDDDSRCATAPSDEIAVKPVETPTTFMVNPDGYSSIKVSFSIIPANAEHDILYRLFRSENNSTFNEIKNQIVYKQDVPAQIPVGTVVSYADKTINPAKTYYYKIKCDIVDRYDYNGIFYSVTDTKEARITPPPAPANLTVNTSSGQMQLSWNEVSSVTGYKIYRSIDDNTYSQVGSVNSASTLTFTDLSAGPATTYYYKVAAYVGSLNGEMSEKTSGQIDINNYIPGKPSATSGTSVKISWQMIEDIDGYRLYRSTASDGTYTQIGGDLSKTPKASTYIAGTNDIIYYYKIAVLKNGTESQKSAYCQARKVKYGADSYEDDDSEYTAKLIALSPTYMSETQTHTLDIDDEYPWGGDYFIVQNKFQYSSYYIKVTFTEIDFNGNSKLVIASGYDYVDINAPGQWVKSSTKISPGAKWICQVYRKEKNTMQYKIKFELVSN
ncbi:MAG: fibronectin type III domain-containing protein [Spirochaetes bacterium]|nr:fibronectin type III domain-containing protein [Spirochaetota bacterium]